MTTAARLALLAILPALMLAGCAPGAGGADGGTSDGGTSGGSSALDCSGAATPGFDLVIDPDLTVEPLQDVYPLAAGDTIAFTDTANATRSFPTYDWETSYIQPSDGSVFFNSGSFFFDEQGGAFTFEGPEQLLGVDGGPYPGFLTVGVTEDGVHTVLGRVCIILAE